MVVVVLYVNFYYNITAVIVYLLHIIHKKEEGAIMRHGSYTCTRYMIRTYDIYTYLYRIYMICSLQIYNTRYTWYEVRGTSTYQVYHTRSLRYIISGYSVLYISYFVWALFLVYLSLLPVPVLRSLSTNRARRWWSLKVVVAIHNSNYCTAVPPTFIIYGIVGYRVHNTYR